MNPLCETCTNIFDFPNCCTENLYDGVKFIAHCKNYSAGLGGYEPECDMTVANTITQNIIAKVADAQECACIEAIRIWAREKGYDDVLLMNEEKLKDIILLGSAEYERLYGEDK